MKKFTWTSVVFYIFVAAIVILPLGHFGRSIAQNKINIASSSVTGDEIHITVSTFDATGMTQEDLGTGFLKRWEPEIAGQVKRDAKGISSSPDSLAVDLDFSYVAPKGGSGEKILAVTRAAISDLDGQALGFTVYIVGIVNEKFKRVGCSRASPDEISITGGPCGEKIKEVFGVTMAKARGLKPEELDIVFLKKWTAEIIREVQFDAEGLFSSLGYRNADLGLSYETIYVMSGTVKLATLQIWSTGGLTFLFVGGVVDDELRRVRCIGRPGNIISLADARCAMKVNEAFGVNISEATYIAREPTGKDFSITGSEIDFSIFSAKAREMTQRDFDADFLKVWEERFRELIKEELKERLDIEGSQDIDMGLTSGARYLERGEVKLPVFHLWSDSGMNILIVGGIVGDELKRIRCLGWPAVGASITDGACAEVVKEVFGVELNEPAKAHAPSYVEAPDKGSYSSVSDEIRVSTTSEDADGLKQEDLNMALLMGWKMGILKQLKLNTRKVYATRGSEDLEPRITSEASYVESGKMKLALLRYSESVIGVTGVFIDGIIGEEFKRVICVRRSLEDISITRGVCSDKIKEVFGVTIDHQAEATATAATEAPATAPVEEVPAAAAEAPAAPAEPPSVEAPEAPAAAEGTATATVETPALAEEKISPTAEAPVAVSKTEATALETPDKDSSTPIEDEIIAVASTEDAGGITQEDFDMDFLETWAEEVIGWLKLGTKDRFVSAGYPDVHPEFSYEAKYVWRGAVKLAILHYRESIRESTGEAAGVIIAGIIKEELRYVECVRNSSVEISTTRGACADKIKEVFDVRVSE